MAGREDGSSELKKLGAQLKTLREAQGLTYDDVAGATHVRPHVIQSIENGAIKEISAPVYARGFVKTYCEYLMASDLWRKYSQGIPTSEDTSDINTESSDKPLDIIDIIQPTPMFRRSSIIWVYMLLVTAVLGAAYLLWSQQKEPGGAEEAFSLRFSETSASADAVLRVPDPILGPTRESDSAAIISGDGMVFDIIAPMDAASSDAVPESAPASEPQGISVQVSSDTSVASSGITPGDLSWMDDTSASARPLAELPQFIDRTLLIEITGANNRLVVEQDSKVVTHRTLGIGGRRSYEVTKDTKVSIGAGNKARVTWFGKHYDSIGSDNTNIVLVFHPDGTVTLVNGKSPHFGPNPPSDSENG
jgi:cytoskeletal protein RodZ